MLNLFSTRNDTIPIMPAKPVFGGGIALKRNRDVASILDNKNICLVSSGYAAILLALKEENISHGDEVLIPAYHCTDLVEPILDMQATPVFYEVNEDVTINIEDIGKQVTVNTKAILVPHFFGVMQNISQMRQSNELLSNMCVIEDYAHAFFLQAPLEYMEGNYIVGSLTKFFPTFDGGVLIARKAIKNTPISLSAIQELKSLYNVMHLATQYGRLKWIAWLFGLMSYLREQSSESENESPANHADAQLSHLDNQNIEIFAASKVSNYIIDHSDFRKIVEKRKQNYSYLLNQLKDEKNLDLSFNCRDSDFIPYMVVAKLKQAEKHHPLLIRKNLPIWRWEHIYPSQYDIAKEHSKSIIQIPCHQQLSTEELSALVSDIKECIKE